MAYGQLLQKKAELVSIIASYLLSLQQGYIKHRFFNASMSVDVKDILEALTKKFEYLVSLHEQTRVYCGKLEQDMATTQQQLTSKEAQVKDLEDKNKSLLVGKAFSSASGQDTEEAKDKISKIVREIDKCIALLSN